MKLFLSCLAFSFLSASAFAQTYWAPSTIDKTTRAPEAINTVVDSNTNATLVTTTHSVQYVFTPAVTASTYAAGYVVGGPLNLVGATRVVGGGDLFKSALAVSSTQVAVNFLVMDTGTAQLTGTYTDHAAAGISAADATHIIRCATVNYSNWNTFGTPPEVADIAPGEGPMVSTTNGFSIIPISSGTSASITATNSITFKFGLTQQ